MIQLAESLNDKIQRLKQLVILDQPDTVGESVTDTFQQFSMLYHRTIAGTTGEFDVKHLTSSPIIPEGVVSVENASNSKRPDLSVIHGLITRSGGEGWRPLTPLRTSLMQYLAAHIE